MVLVVVEFSPDFFRQVFSLVSCHLSRISWFWGFSFVVLDPDFFLHQQTLLLHFFLIEGFVSSTFLELLFMLGIL